MSLSPGDAWGALAPLPADTPVVSDDRALAQLLESTDPPSLVALAGGDLCRTLGGRGDVADRLGGETTVAPIDVGSVTAGTTTRVFVAHVVVRNRWWSGPSAVVMNAEWLGAWRLGPRSHPGDGLLDITRGQLGLRERVLARRRSRSGDHLPHPALKQQRTAEATLDLDRSRSVWADGVSLGTHREVTVSLRPSAIMVAV